LRAKKVPCDPVPEPPEVLEDPQLKFRGMMPELLHPHSGPTGLKAAGFPIHFSGLPGGFASPAPSIGQHNREVYGGLLGISVAEMEKLENEGII
jgi:crotonobetainyl-CoA:carnitine CoA-transferase CaiB-like acyl-CoA transferase